MIIKRFTDKLVDALFDCSFIEQNAYFIEDGAFWRESVFHCRRCGKVETIAQVLIDNDEFWEIDSPYILSIEQHER